MDVHCVDRTEFKASRYPSSLPPQCGGKGAAGLRTGNLWQSSQRLRTGGGFLPQRSIAMNEQFLAVLGLMALLASAPAAAQKGGAGTTAGNLPTTQNRMVFQINEDDSRKWNTILANLNNVQEELGKADISVVVIGAGLGMLKADALTANGVQDAIAAGVRFVACGNSMQSMKLTKDDMIDGIAHAKAGYVEIMRLQQLGYAYIRP
jgi:intracellular sulfur oxidation DsrE/DsrF family protein